MGLAEPGELTVGFTNLVACKPQDKKGAAFRPPNDLEIETCQPRLKDTIVAFNPLIVVALGRLPDEWVSGLLKTEYSYFVRDYFRIPHPSSILRQGGEDAPKKYPDYTRSAWDDYIEMFEVLFQRTRELKNPTVALFKPVGRV
jgi:uracil-DNA glycosylase